MTPYVLELEIDGVKRREALNAIPESLTIRLYSVDVPTLELLVERVVK